MKKLLMLLFLMTISLGQSQNLITNGDFESGDTAWSGAAGNLVTDNGNTYFSRTVANAGNPWDANLSRPMSITTPVGTGYTLTFQAWSTTGRTLIAGIGLNGGDYSNVNQTVTLTSTPKRFTLNFNTNFSSESSRIIFDMGNVVGDVNIDNVVLSLTPTNLITNGDFEGGDTGWTGATGNLVTTGDDASYFSTTVSNAGNPWDVNLSRPVSIAAAVGTSYQLSFQAWSSTGRTIIAGIGLAGAPYTNVTQTVTLTSTPQTFFLDLTSNFSDASSRIIFDMGNVVGDVNIDNVVLSSAVATSTCNNGVQDGDETGIDCGGTCPACATVVNIEGKWKVTELGVGPAKGSYLYFSVNASSGARSCYFDDVYQFNADASFNFIPGSQTYNEGWLGSGCGAAVAPFDGSNAATYTNSGSAITVTGTGAFIGLPKAINGAEISSTEAHPGTVTYQATSVTTTAMTLDINVGGNWWRYKLAKVDESLPIISDFPALEKGIAAEPFDLATPTSNSAGAFTYTSSNEAVATISGSTVTIHGAGTTTITATQAANGAFNTGSITAQLVVSYPAPTDAAPTPTKAVEDVISIFSGAPYTDFVGVSPYSFHGSTAYASVNAGGNPTNRYTNFDYVGNTFGAGGADVSAMEFLHLDIWTPNCTTFRVFVLDGGPENSVTLTPSLNGWNSFDIPLSSYSGLNKSHITEFKYDNGGGSTIYMDNLYFWKTPSGFYNYYADADNDGYGAGTVNIVESPTAPSGYVANNTDCNDANAAINPGATEIADSVDNDCDGKIDEGFPPSTAAPTPIARNPWDVKSIFSGAYSNVTLNELPTDWSQIDNDGPFQTTNIAGNPTWNFKGQFLGMVTNYGAGVDLSQMTTMHIDYWTPDSYRIDLKLVNSGVGEAFTSLGTTVAGSWQSIDIPLSQYGTLDLSKINQILIDPTDAATLYIDNFYFYRAETTIPAPVVANVTQCKGAPAVELTAATFPGYGLKWYAKSTDTAALATTPKTTSTTSGTKTSYVALYKIPDGTPGPKAAISVVTNTEVTPAVSSTLLLKNSSAAIVTAVGPFIGTATEFTLEAAASTTALASYKWTLPNGVNQVFTNSNATINDRIITVIFNGDSALGGTTAALPISVQSTNATGGCPSAAKTLNLTRAIPAAPSNLKMNNGLNTTPITSFAKYMGTGTILRLSAAVASTARNYVWELPEGVQRVFGIDNPTIYDNNYADYLESNSPEIFVTFTGVTNANTATLVNTNVLRIGVKSKNAVGVSTTSNGTLANPSTASTAKLLTLSAVKPAAPSSLKMYDLAVSATAAVTAITKYVNTDTELKLEAKASALASSYTWVLYDGVNVTNGSAEAVLGSPNTYTSTSNAITINFNYVPHEGAFSLVLGVKAVNGVGESVSTNAAPNASRTDKLLTLTAALPSVPGAVTGSLKICATTASSVTYTIAALAANARDYFIEAPQGCTITWSSGGYTYTSCCEYGHLGIIEAVANATFTINYPAGFVVTTANPKTITIRSESYVGPSATSKVLKLTNVGATCGGRIAQEAATATEAFNVVAYPNPSSSEFTIATSAEGAINAKVYDMQGRLVENAKSNKVGSSLAPGIYNVIVSQGANTKSVRLIKK